jgi:PD-(D/E)XK nuclease superfamily protein
MAGQICQDSKRSPRTSLYLASSFGAAWENVLLPWFETMATGVPENRGQVAVVVPFRSHAYHLRRKLLARGISLLGVRFLVSGQLREILLRNSGLNLPLREHLRLLFAIAAEDIPPKIDTDQSEYLIARSVAGDPDYFLRIFDKLGAAGWSLTQIDQPVLNQIAARFEKICRECGFAFIHEADRLAVASAEKLPPRFGRMLITGFDGVHWPLWPLLHAAVKSSTQATVVLSDPRDEARDLDETWVGTWEEAFGAAEPVGDCAENTQEKLRLHNIHFIVGRDTTEQARAIVALTAKFLCEKNCERVGILFPQKDALPRLVATFLASAQIAHNDGIAHVSPSVFDDGAWRAWLELQQNSRLKFLFQFLRAVDAEIFENVSILEIEEKLRDAYNGVLIDDIEVLREFCARSEGKVGIARGLEKIRFLPAASTFSEFLRQTKTIFAEFGWKQRWNEVERLSRNWAGRVPQRFTRDNYLRWLREIFSAPSLSRDACGAHPYSRVHLLPYAEAEGQSWSHLIFAGLNEEAWPALDEEFVADPQIDEFNQRNRALNRRAVRPGRHGEGQWSIVEGKTFLLGSSERRGVRRRQLRNLIELPTAGIGVTANLYSETAPSRIANPTDFFSRVYFEARGRGVSQQTLQALEEQTRAWLSDWSPVDAQKVDSTDVGRTGYAYSMRRQPHAFDQYEFALRTPPERPVTFRVTDWEAVLKSPAIVWMKIFLGVEADKENGDAWAAATGQWVHHWLAESVRAEQGDTFVALRDTEEIRRRILDSAKQFKRDVGQLCAATGRRLPDWWVSGWSNAVYVADSLAVKLSGLSGDWTHMGPEWKLDSPTSIVLATGESLRVRGRIDLILARGERDKSRLGFSDLWVIDYKTGRQRAFTLHELRKKETPQQKLCRMLLTGRGVQLGLYALAVQALGASNVQLSLLGLADELEPQFDLKHVLAETDFWRELHRMQESGVFGMVGPVHAEYGFARNYPLATLAIDEDLLREKWVMTHPALATEQEDHS